MAGGEHEPQEVVGDVLVEARFERALHRLQREVGVELTLHVPPLPIDDAAMTEQVELTVLGRGHQPRGWLLGRARRGPLLERSDERVARELSASATSRTTRASEAMSFGASLFQMSAIAACASDEDTARVHHP